MSLDGLVVHTLVQELQSCVGGRMNKIYQPSETELIFQIRAKGENKKLLLSANATYPRVYLTNKSYKNPEEAPMFCMLLRKHCENSIIESITQVDSERIIHIVVRQRNELGDIVYKRLIIEIMGRHSNIILIDPTTNQIFDSIKHITPAISTYRIIMPGNQYTDPPEQKKSNPLFIQKAAFTANIMMEDALNHADWDTFFRQQLVQTYNGISPLIAKELVYRAHGMDSSNLTSDEFIEKLWHAFSQVMEWINNEQIQPTVITSEKDKKSYFYLIPLAHIQGKEETFTSMSACLESFYASKAERDTIKQRASDLFRFVQNEKKKNENKLLKLKDTLEKAKDADQYRIKGELLTASLHEIEKGADAVEVVNYYDEAQQNITIALNPQLTPSENAQQYFKKYTKSKNSLHVVNEQIEAAEVEISYFASLMQQLDSATLSDIEEMREELIEQKYLRNRKSKKMKKKKNNQPVISCFTSSEGIPIYVGKNNIQNEYVTQKLAHSSDTWLHTKDIPGSHVVIRSKEFGDATLLEAAQLAAYFSQARESSQVPVDYTYIKHVKKPNGSKPGFVIYEHQKTLYITPDAEQIQRLTVSSQ